MYNTRWPGRIEKIKFKNKYYYILMVHIIQQVQKNLINILKENNIRPNVIFGMLNNKKAFEFLSIT